MTDRLFAVEPIPEPEPGEPALSYTRRVTVRNRETLARGQHPVTHEPLLAPIGDHTCGDCAHHKVITHNRSWHKCDLRDTASIATDIRIGWPACIRWAEIVAYCSHCGQSSATLGDCSRCHHHLEEKRT